MMDGTVNFKKVFLITMIIFLSISALIGIIIFLAGSFGSIEMKIIGTTLAIGGFSLTALCSAALYDKRRFIAISVLGMATAVIGLLIAVISLWAELDIMWKTAAIAVILSASLAQSSLLLLIRSQRTIVNVSRAVTIMFIITVAVMLISLVLTELDIGVTFFYKLLGVFVILDALGTTITPIILKVTSLNKKENSVSA